MDIHESCLNSLIFTKRQRISVIATIHPFKWARSAPIFWPRRIFHRTLPLSLPLSLLILWIHRAYWSCRVTLTSFCSFILLCPRNMRLRVIIILHRRVSVTRVIIIISNLGRPGVSFIIITQERLITIYTPPCGDDNELWCPHLAFVYYCRYTRKGYCWLCPRGQS